MNTSLHNDGIGTLLNIHKILFFYIRLLRVEIIHHMYILTNIQTRQVESGTCKTDIKAIQQICELNLYSSTIINQPITYHVSIKCLLITR